MGDHTETIQIDFDPEIITYEELLDIFWESHHPTSKSIFRDRQYMSLLMYHDDSQKQMALASKRKWEETLGKNIQTEFVPDAAFYPAEDYHQKYFLKRFKKVTAALHTLYPTEEELRDATVVARLNGFVRGRGSMEALKNEISKWGWSEKEEKETFDVLNSLRW